MQRETKQSISVLALVFAIFAFAGYGYAATANYTNVSNIYNYSVFNNSGINYSGTNLYNYYNNGTFQSIGYDIISNVLYFEYHNVSFNSAGFEHNNSTIYNNYNNSVIDNINQLNSTITNYFNYTNYDHASLQNLSYSASGHTGFESSTHASTTYETISNVGALGTAYRFHEHQSPFGGALGNGGQVSYTDLKNTPNLSEKLNRTDDISTNLTIAGGYITENLKAAGSQLEFVNESSLLQLGFYDIVEPSSTFGAVIRANVGRGFDPSTQTTLLGKYGNSTIGYSFQQSSYLPTNSLRGLRFRFFPVNSTTATTYLTSNEENTTLNLGNFTVTNLSGTGNAYVCVDSNGKMYRGSPGC